MRSRCSDQPTSRQQTVRSSGPAEANPRVDVRSTNTFIQLVQGRGAIFVEVKQQESEARNTLYLVPRLRIGGVIPPAPLPALTL